MSFFPGIDPAPGDKRASDAIETNIVVCVSCGNLIDESLDVSAVVRNPCANCGSLGRRFEASIVETVTASVKLGVKHKVRGVAKPIFESVGGLDYHRKTGKWNQLERVIDRQNDWYEEKVVDPESGAIVHHCAEKLSDHRGHGSAITVLSNDAKSK
jgi:predicted RNA-binding Zn-ribbon protein involved in translation (DUF1610 family)